MRLTMSKEFTKISGGTLYDPANGIDGEVRDLWISAGKIVAPPSDPQIRPTCTIDASGLVVMPGGIDMHCHIAGPKVNAARKLRPDDRRNAEPVRRTARTRSGTMGSVPSTFATGYKYAALGYTTAFDAAVPPLLAAHAHAEFADTPCLDKGCYLLMGNNHYVMKSIRDKEPAKLRAFIGWLLSRGKGYAPKLVNPGGVEAWKGRNGSRNTGLDDTVPHFDVTPRQIISEVAQAAADLRLPHPVHIHCNQLGMPGNWQTTLETMRALEDRRGHLTHIQFHSYGGGDADEGTFSSKVAGLADYVNTHPQLTVDVGQVLFGETTSMTGDGPLGHFLANLYGRKWISCDVEMEAGCGISPIEYKNKSLIHALQWAIGLEWYLMVEDPWQVMMSTDHPNGGSFLAYPQIIRLLMDRTYRSDMLKSCHPNVVKRSSLADLDREYTLNEIAIITRAGPAKILGLIDKGHLGLGAAADITIYTPNENQETMFELPRMVIKAGEIVVEQGEIRSTPQGNILHVDADYDREVEPDIQAWFEDNYSVNFANYGVE
ncbi:Formyltransferase/hydrolase complex Fhc subunit A [Bythopirellula goksoeyrii]|uniref:Formyltransferase/hydrolase complex Fhc subunit A n=2 Tax=Bythopirellula goksoeyrii TaxID=1400387 RepID=A0A5B9QSS9_9BACT|nr:Formyltransferase/hydrolase complex Fhc subunit A [Bythopirellula goksoeyrii]